MIDLPSYLTEKFNLEIGETMPGIMFVVLEGE
jgi:hypothetical protein